MGNQHGGEVQACRRAEQPADEDKHQHQRDTGDDIRVNHRDVSHGVEGCMVKLVSKSVHPHSSSSAENGGDHRCTESQHQGIAHGTQGFRIFKQLFVPVEREPGKDGEAFARIEGKEQQDRDGSEEENHDQSRIDFRSGFHLRLPPFRLLPACWLRAATAPCTQAGSPLESGQSPLQNAGCLLHTGLQLHHRSGKTCRFQASGKYKTC